ncbi:MAG TPA: Gfo/Idh/MocA family oxidoreductase [Bryobacteraceae bacterium]|nr:Gfo/Idh/MocA family oxidoreductase [Bryobacteraceae bacterium]
MNIDRRYFLLGSAAAAQSALSQTDATRIPTAMIGVGNRGSYVLKGVLEQPNARVAALCDLKPARLDTAATVAAKDNPATYADWRKIIDRKDIDAVFIATPPHLHAEMAVAAIQAGKHVYCEKPIGITPEQVRDVVNAARGNSKVFVAGQQMRSFRQMQRAIEQIRKGAIGDVVMVKAQRHGPADLPHDSSSGDWYFDVNKSGGYLIEMSVHNVDACNWAIGAHPVRASGFGGTLLYKNDPPGRTIFDCGVLAYDYANGAKMSFTQSVFHPAGMPGGNQYIHVFGTKGSVDLLPSTNMYPLQGKGSGTPLAAKVEEPPHAHVTAFYDCISKGGPNPADITVGATAALTAIMGHLAMTKQKVITWDELGVQL